MSTNLKNILVWLAIVVSLILLWQLFYSIKDVNIQESSFTSYYQDINEKKVKAITVTGDEVEWETIDGKKFKTIVPLEVNRDLINENVPKDKVDIEFKS